MKLTLVSLGIFPFLALCLPPSPLDGVSTSLQATVFDEFDSQVSKQISTLVSRSPQLVGTASYSPLPYWSVQQSEVVPACRVDVTSAKDVSKVLKVSKLTKCPFNVKSGGHAAFAGGSSIDGGILINLAPLNAVELSKDRKTARVGAGNVWSDVYKVLDPKNVSVVGGREAGVGVGGLTLGGGISYFSGRYGWACDNVRSYEIVLADGSITTASPTANPDLYRALRGGGGSNFGIVTHFNMAAFEQGLLWGGNKFHPIATNRSLITAFSNFVEDAPTDDFAHLFIAFVYAEELGGYFGNSGPVYGKPEPNPPIFDEIKRIPSFIDTTSVASLNTLAIALNQTQYQRQTFQTITIKNDVTLLNKVFDIFIEESRPLLGVPGFLPSLAYQPISLNIIRQMQKNGGNTLGLTEADGPLAYWGWNESKDDELVMGTLARVLSRSVALAKAAGKDNRYIYMNYAPQGDAVYAGYGADNLKKLGDVKKKYDPTNVFGKLWPGYFKL